MLRRWLMGLVGQPNLTEESLRFSVHSTKPTTDCRRYNLAQPSRSTRSTADGSCFFALSSHTDVFKFSFFPGTIVE